MTFPYDFVFVFIQYFIGAILLKRSSQNVGVRKKRWKGGWPYREGGVYKRGEGITVNKERKNLKEFKIHLFEFFFRLYQNLHKKEILKCSIILFQKTLYPDYMTKSRKSCQTLILGFLLFTSTNKNHFGSLPYNRIQAF